MDRKELSNEDFVKYFKRLSKEDKIAAFGELFERFKNACEENRKAYENYDVAGSIFEKLKRMPGYSDDGMIFFTFSQGKEKNTYKINPV